MYMYKGKNSVHALQVKEYSHPFVDQNKVRNICVFKYLYFL